MSERHDDHLRELLEQIDARLRDAERLRNYAEHRRERPFWPDRRHIGRVPAPVAEDSRGSAAQMDGGMAGDYEPRRYTPGQNPKRPMPAGRITVLLVDSFADEREMFSSYLETVGGFRVIATDSPEAARRELAVDAVPDVIVVRGWSVRPSSDCLVFARDMRQSHVTRHTPIILLTTDGFSDKTIATNAGCDAVFLLPVLPNDLAQAINQLAERAHSAVRMR